jgi:hypothetical protein
LLDLLWLLQLAANLPLTYQSVSGVREMVASNFVELVGSIKPADLLCVLAVACLLLAFHLAARRLYFSPIHHIPGPKFAAMTQLYEFYYDIILGGQYTFKILELHKKYGPVIRINPWEVHVGDPNYFSEVYGGPGKCRDRWSFYTSQFAAPGTKQDTNPALTTPANRGAESVLCTVDHNHHRLRRAALDSFFSARNIRQLQPVLDERAGALLRRLDRDAKASSQSVDLVYLFSAFTNGGNLLRGFRGTEPSDKGTRCH